MSKKIFYIEDELLLGKIVKETLEKIGYEVLWETDGAKVVGHLNEFSPDVCVLDIMLPNIDGYSLCRTIRGMFPKLPIIFLTAKTTTADLVAGFEAGGTDYIRKPFSIEEVVARIDNQINLNNGITSIKPGNDKIAIGKYELIPSRYELHTPAGKVKLSNRDMEILKILVANRNRTTNRKDLLMMVWGDDSFFNSRNLDVYIRKLRQYFRSDPSVQIKTLKGQGYLFLVL